VELPWGKFEHTGLAQVIAQFRDIFLEEQYAFRTSSPAPVIIDCGGNLGLSAIWFRRQHPNCRLVVYEADPALVPTLKRNLDHAHLEGVLVRNAAVWTHKGLVRFAPTGRDTGKLDENGSLQVEAVDLAEQLPASVDVLKLDIEGAEYEVLKHLCTTKAIERVKNVVFELHVSQSKVQEMLELLGLLRTNGFRLAMTGQLASWLGFESDECPFGAVGRNQMFLIVYAWRQPVV